MSSLGAWQKQLFLFLARLYLLTSLCKARQQQVATEVVLVPVGKHVQGVTEHVPDRVLVLALVHAIVKPPKDEVEDVREGSGSRAGSCTAICVGACFGSCQSSSCL